jgi:DNA polymerase elongation subunit (family B)
MGSFTYRPYALTPLKKSSKIPTFNVFDIETDVWLDDTYGLPEEDVNTWHNRPIQTYLVTFYDGKDTFYFDGENAFKDFLAVLLHKRYRGTVTYVHNGGKFDIIWLYDQLVHDKELNKKYHVKPLMQHARIMAFRFKDDHKHHWQLRDSYSILPHSLRALCDDFDPTYKKLTMPTVPYEKDKRAWKKYCAHDCYSLHNVLNLFFNTLVEAGGMVAYTAGSIAMRSWRAIALNQNLPTYLEYNKMFHEAFYGGRTEAFIMLARDTGKPYYYYDVNSMYPYVMANYEYPSSKPQSVEYQDPLDCSGKCGIMECHVVAPEDLHIPLLPCHLNGKLLFPLGEWDGFYEFSFIEKAVEMGYKITPKRTWEFESDPLFREYIMKFHALKQQSKGAAKNVYKLLMNSLFGKFAERPEKTEIITDPDEDLEGATLIDPEFGYFVRHYERHAAHHLPAISIRVTALAQLTLYKYIQEIQEKGGNIYYCDTDSIITDIRLPVREGLGALEMKFDFSKGVFFTPKVYYLEPYDQKIKDKMGNVACKGFSRHFRERLTYEMLEEALLTEDYSLLEESVVRPASLGEIRVRHLAGFVTIVQKRAMRSPYDKRTVFSDYTTSPLKIRNGSTEA